MKRGGRWQLAAIVLLLLANLLIAALRWTARPAATPQAAGPPALPGPVAGAPSAVPAEDGRKPYRNDVTLQYWAFSPQRTWFAARGQMTALLDGSFAVTPIRNPTFLDVATENVVVAPTARLVELNRRPQYQGYSSVAPVLVPSKPLRVGEAFKYDLSWTEARVPYLHDDRPPFYMLSIRIDPFPDEPRTEFHFAIPDRSSQIATTDMQPVGSRRFPGWIVYDYVARRGLQTLIHITYNVSGQPSAPPPSAEAVFSGG